MFVDYDKVFDFISCNCLLKYLWQSFYMLYKTINDKYTNKSETMKFIIRANNTRGWLMIRFDLISL